MENVNIQSSELLDVNKKTGFPSIDKNHEKNFQYDGNAMPLMTIYDYIYQNNKFFLENYAFDYLGARITYKQFFDNINKTVQSLKEYGVKEGDFVTLMLPTQPETFYLIYALSRIGAVANLVDPRYPASYLEHAIDRVDSKLVIATTATNDALKNAKKNTSCEELIMISPSNSVTLMAILNNLDLLKNAKNMKTTDFAKGCINWKQFLKDGRNVREIILPKYEQNRTVVTIGTGGTTGEPKLVELTNDTINGAVYQCINAGFDFKREHTWYDLMPDFIAFGVVDGLHLPLVKGMETVLEPQPSIESMIKAFNRRNKMGKPINHMAGGPNFYTELIKHPDAQNIDFSAFYSPILGGKNINVNHEKTVNEFLETHGGPTCLRVGYGLTECAGAASAPGTEEYAKAQSAGLTMPMCVVSTFRTIENEDGSVSYKELPYVPNKMGYNVPDEFTGEICISGPNVMKGYYNNEEATKNTLIEHDGRTWLHTGDIGFVDEDGVVYIVGRSKEFVARYTGFKTPPKEIEDVILLDPAIDDVKVVGFDNPEIDNDQLLKVYYTLKPGYNDIKEIEERLQLLCESKLPDFKWPSAYECLDVMPLTPVAKIDIKKLQQDANEKAIAKHNQKIKK